MIKIAHVVETKSLQLPKEVVKITNVIAEILDLNYGVNRNINEGDSGYAIIQLDSNGTLQKIIGKRNIRKS